MNGIHEPLVSCLTPTWNRREFIPRAVECFLSQDYPNLEWVIDDDGEPILDLLPAHPRIKYFHEEPKRCHGVKMNRCFELSAGEYGIVFDDDDWYAPSRVREQIMPLIQNRSKVVSGLGEFFYYVHGSHTAYRYNAGMIPWMGAIALRRTTWEQYRFDTSPAPGADNRLLKMIPLEAWHRVQNPGLVIAAIHGSNDCRKQIPDVDHITSPYSREPWSTIQALTGWS